MSEFLLDLKIDGGRTAFRPREELRGVAIIDNQGHWEVEYVNVIAFWRTEGKGTEDEGIFAIDEVAREGARSLVGEVEHPFRFELPDMPWSYHGRVLKIHWMLGLYAKGRGGKAQSVEIPFTMHPEPEALLAKA